MKNILLVMLATSLTGCGAGCNDPQPIELAPSMQTQWCSIDPVTHIQTGNACPQ